MKKNYVLIISALFFISSCSTINKKPYPKLVMDDKYSLIQKEDAVVTPQNYQLESLNGFIWDCSKHDFSFIRQINKGKDPDMIHIISRSGTFTTNLNVKGETVVDSSSMHSLDEKNKVFTGFIKGDTATIAIGYLDTAKGVSEMTAFWLARIEIK